MATLNISVRVPNRSSTIAKKKAARNGSLGLPAKDFAGLAKSVRAGFSFEKLARFQKRSQLPLSLIANKLQIPPRTLARRKARGKLTSQESERLLRLARLFDHAVELFEGDASAAVTWLQAGNKALGGQAPLDVAKTEIGAREVEDLIGRLEYGVYS